MLPQKPLFALLRRDRSRIVTGQPSCALRSTSAGVGFTGNARRAISSIAASCTEFPNTASGAESPPTQRRHLALIGRHIHNHIGHHAILHLYARRQHPFAGIPNRRTPSSITQLFVELTAQISTPCREARPPTPASRERYSAQSLRENTCRTPHLFLAQPLIHLHHLPADRDL